MKSSSFEYVAPTTISEALSLLESGGGETKLLAGGQSLVPLLNLRLARPTRLVDLNRVRDLSELRLSDAGYLLIGPMVRLRTIEGSTLIRDRWPLLAEAIPHVGHVAIRNRGTVGGSLAHADPAAELPAVMVALDAELRVRSTRGERVIRASDFFISAFTTLLEADEMVVEISIPPLPARTGHSFQEFSRRRGDFGLAVVAALVRLESTGEVADVRLSFAGVGPSSLSATTAEKVLIGARPTIEALESAARQVCAILEPTSDIHGSSSYRRHLAGVLAFRALEVATFRAGQGG